MGSNTFLIAQIVYTLYRHRKEFGNYLESQDAQISQGDFYRMFALGLIDSLLTLPITTFKLTLSFLEVGTQFSFYQGWTLIHSDWEPALVPKRIWSTYKWIVVVEHWSNWTGPFTAVVFFSLYGLTPEARKGYHRFFRLMRKPFGVKQAESPVDELPGIVFNSRERTTATGTSDISNRYGRSRLYAHNHLHYIITKQYTRRCLGMTCRPKQTDQLTKRNYFARRR